MAAVTKPRTPQTLGNKADVRACRILRRSRHKYRAVEGDRGSTWNQCIQCMGSHQVDQAKVGYSKLLLRYNLGCNYIICRIKHIVEGNESASTVHCEYVSIGHHEQDSREVCRGFAGPRVTARYGHRCWHTKSIDDPIPVESYVSGLPYH